MKKYNRFAIGSLGLAGVLAIQGCGPLLNAGGQSAIYAGNAGVGIPLSALGQGIGAIEAGRASSSNVNVNNNFNGNSQSDNRNKNYSDVPYKMPPNPYEPKYSDVPYKMPDNNPYYKNADHNP
ncbi:MAG: hypothetical protein AABW79_04640 [Nanoarchaeota archaeon]